jgi:8-oxo-dGTP pyrophosphatase MutT (NUDIX family)
MRHAVLAIITNKSNNILLQHKDNFAPVKPNRWCLFAGEIEPGETPEQALARELFEELEFKLDDYKFFRIYEGGGIKRYIFTVRTDLAEEELKSRQHEGDNLGYFSAAQIDGLNVVQPHLNIIREYFKLS